MNRGRRAVAAALGASAWLGWPGLVRVAGAQATSDVPYVPTPWAVVEAMFKLARVGRGDFLIDLGSGDGRIVNTAARDIGLSGLGIELDGNLVHTATLEAKRLGVADRVQFVRGNIFDVDFGRATVLTMYLLPAVNLQLRPRVLALKPGTRIVSHDFDMADWKPDGRVSVPVPGKSYGPPESTIFLWVVPARAAGRWEWTLPDGRAVEVGFDQVFQTLSGRASVARSAGRLEDARLEGDCIAFAVRGPGAADVRYAGRIAGDRIEGTLHAPDGTAPWTARRTAAS